MFDCVAKVKTLWKILQEKKLIRLTQICRLYKCIKCFNGRCCGIRACKRQCINGF